MSLENLRDAIDAIDDDILKLFEKRMDVVSQIAAYKRANGIPVLDGGREAEKIRAVSGKIKPQLESYAHTLFNTLFALSRDYQSAD